MENQNKGNRGGQQNPAAQQEKAQRGGQGGGAGAARGQAKEHEIRNAETGESRMVSQQEWRTNGKALREAGFERVDAPEETATEEETATGGTEPTAEGGAESEPTAGGGTA